jgi:osmoprotectant transport system permease protein
VPGSGRLRGCSAAIPQPLLGDEVALESRASSRPTSRSGSGGADP